MERGQPPEPELTRLLATYLEKDVVTDGAALRPYVTAFREMVEAGTSDAQVAGYLKHVEQEVDVLPFASLHLKRFTAPA